MGKTWRRENSHSREEGVRDLEWKRKQRRQENYRRSQKTKVIDEKINPREEE